MLYLMLPNRKIHVHVILIKLISTRTFTYQLGMPIALYQKFSLEKALIDYFNFSFAVLKSRKTADCTFM